MHRIVYYNLPQNCHLSSVIDFQLLLRAMVSEMVQLSATVEQTLATHRHLLASGDLAEIGGPREPQKPESMEALLLNTSCCSII